MLLLWLVYPSDKTGKFLSLICRFAWLKACTPSETMAFRYPLQLVADSAKTPSDGTLFRRKSRRFCDVGCCSSFIAVFVMLVVVIFMFPGYFSMLPTLHLGFSGPRRPPPAELYTLATFVCFTFPSHFYRKSYGFEWVFLTHRCFLRYAPSPHLCSFTTTYFYQGLPGSLQFFLAVCRASASGLIFFRPGPSACLIHSNPQSRYSEEFVFKPYQILS